MSFPSLNLRLPDWIEPFIKSYGKRFDSPEKRMGLVINLARENVTQQSGGPFAAAVFNMETGELIAPGVNVVVSSSCSIAHAEIMALSLSQQILGTFDLGAQGIPSCELVTSTAPCAMCLGAIPWSGVRRIVCGARDEDARSIGFDEGAKVKNWAEELQKRGIEVIEDVCRKEAAMVLDWYKSSGGIIYNGRKSEK